MAEELQFSSDAAVIDRLGRELVGRQETALTELVKNSYDADATEVKVVFDRNTLTINDNGTGMSRSEIEAGYLRLASGLKVSEPKSQRYKRSRAGQKGIGRFSAQRLGDELVLQTWTSDKEPGLQLTVNWNKFKQGMKLEDISVELTEIDAREETGTLLQIGGLRDDWTDSQIKRCYRNIMSLQQPFPVAPVSSKPNKDPGFDVEFWKVGEIYDDPEIVADLQTEVLDHLHAVIEFRVSEGGKAEWRIVQNRFGEDVGWTRIHHDAGRDEVVPNYEHLRSAWMKSHYFILDSNLFPSLLYTRLRDVLREEGGIRLYRNGFRVIPYGSRGDDWLRLDEYYSSRSSVLAPLRNINFFGAIDVADEEGERFEEHTSREGLIETPAFTELKLLANAVIRTAVNRISNQRARAPKSKKPVPKLLPQSHLDRIRDAQRKAREAAEEAEKKGDTGSASQARIAEGLFKETAEDIASAQAELADEAALLRLLATLGLTTAEFSHETGMTFDAFRLDFDHVFQVAAKAAGEDKKFASKSERARSMLDRLDALTSYLNELASARSVRELSPVSVSKALNEFKKGMSQLAQKSDIELIVDAPPLDPLFTKPMHQAEIASILLNFYSNAVKAMKSKGGERRVEVAANRVKGAEDEIEIVFSDTGDGIAEPDRERIFERFYTTRVAAGMDKKHSEQMTGTGLGLWIVSQIVDHAGGEVEVVEPKKGFSTSMRVTFPSEES